MRRLSRRAAGSDLDERGFLNRTFRELTVLSWPPGMIGSLARVYQPI